MPENIIMTHGIDHGRGDTIKHERAVIMARKTDSNLIPFNKRTAEEQREIQRKGGIASGKARRAVKTFKQALADDLTEEEIETMLAAQKKLAAKGSLNSLEFLMKMLGQHPDQEQTTDNSIQITINGGDDYTG